ncbi:division/cell wall cluster transcriptional repressor MraZ|uniref:division/cell wall cluster transcriptional repressor MraZ n=1 Tax=Noviherbaspirillum sp. L7-7A TaxID=2850560 RepID=UPI001C2C2187|nr:division/cell wall cluster transcriptional repressor MraZ [Noviherbaspirillum sp. L7-7A]MBV0878055.1 division/cell wall cluster transcriptional repressor MraZ [Noviherbaspirillum sp. L7-7A]
MDAGSIPAASTINKTPPKGGFLLMVSFLARTRAMRGEGRVEICMRAVAVKDAAARITLATVARQHTGAGKKQAMTCYYDNRLLILQACR